MGGLTSLDLLPQSFSGLWDKPREKELTLGEVATVRIRRRTGRFDTISLTDTAITTALHQWLSERPSVGVDALFLSHHSKPLSKRAVQFLIAGYLQQALITGASVHTLRHTMAVHHAAQGVDLRVIQETLGFSSLCQAEQYLVAAKRAQHKALEEHAL